MKNHAKSIFAIIAFVLAIGLATAAVMSNLTYAQTVCSNAGGNLPPGQQLKCNGKGLTLINETNGRAFHN